MKRSIFQPILFLILAQNAHALPGDATPLDPPKQVLAFMNGIDSHLRSDLLQELMEIKLAGAGRAGANQEFERRFNGVIWMLQNPDCTLPNLNQELAQSTQLIAESQFSELSGALMVRVAALREMSQIASLPEVQKQLRLRKDLTAARELMQSTSLSGTEVAAYGAGQLRTLDEESVGAVVIGLQGQANAEIFGKLVPLLFKVESGWQKSSLTGSVEARFVQPRAGTGYRYVIEPASVTYNGVTDQRSYAGVGVAVGNPLLSRSGESFRGLIIRPVQTVTQTGIVGHLVSDRETVRSLIFFDREAISDQLRTLTQIEMGRGQNRQSLLAIQFIVEYGFGASQKTRAYGEFNLSSATLQARNSTGPANQRTTSLLFGLGIRRILN